MIRFKYVIDARTGDKYMVTAVKLVDDGYCTLRDDDIKNEYEVDLQPCSVCGRMYENVPLIVSTDADIEEIFMAHDWEEPYQSNEDGDASCAMDEVIASGCVLLFPMDELMQQIYCEKRIE